MSSSMLRRLALGVLVLALAFPSHAAAAPWPFEDLLGRVRGFFSSLWAPHDGAAPTPIFGELGCEADPDGRCGAAPTQILGEHGCEIMPDGRCGAAPTQILGEIGCELLPDGRCRG